MANVTLVEFLMVFWTIAAQPDTDRYDLLKSALQAKNHDITHDQLKQARRSFNKHLYRYPLGDKCWLCGDVWSKVMAHDRYLVRHHILPLKKGGTNRRINIVILCDHCHAYMHPWLFKKPEPEQVRVEPTFLTDCCRQPFTDLYPLIWNPKERTVRCGKCGHRYVPLGATD